MKIINFIGCKTTLAAESLTQRRKMIKSSRELVFDEIVKDNFVSNQDIMDRTGLNENLVRTNIHRLKKAGLIDSLDENESRKFVILRNFSTNQSQKKALYEEMIDVYMEDFINASTFEDRLKVGREVRLLIEKL